MKIVVNGIWPIPEELKTKNCLAKTQRRKGTQREEFGRGEAGFTADVAYCVAGKVNSTDKLYPVIESVRPDTRHSRSSTLPVPADGAGGLPIA